MATAIHHGAPGSFKSFTLVQRFAIDALKQGRAVVHNIRGFNSLDLIKEQFPDIHFPDTARLITVNTDLKSQRAVMARWFHWAPIGALILIDEAQRIYPKKLKLDTLDFPDTHIDYTNYQFVPPGYEPDVIRLEIFEETIGQTITIGRPEDFQTSCTMQRHYNWDLFISTPNIDMLQSDFRDVAEYAYLHQALSGKIPWLFKNQWYEYQHNPNNNGSAKSHRIGNPRKYKADTRVFNCYRSTITGEHLESQAGQSILSDSSVRFKLAAIVLGISYGIYSIFNFISIHEKPALDVPATDSLPSSNPPVSSSPASSGSQSTASPPVVASDHVPNQQIATAHDDLAIKPVLIVYHDITDPDHKKMTFLVKTQAGLQSYSDSQIRRLGYSASVHSLCSVTLIHANGTLLRIGCESPFVDRCLVKIESEYFISQHDCHSLDDPKPQSITPNNALLAASESFVH